ncbi:MAG: hypothetical protein AAB518_03000 [Patescibacteria group bacterium]
MAFAVTVMLSACGGGGGGGDSLPPPPDPQVAHATQGIGGGIMDIAIVDATSSSWYHDVEFDLGSGYRFRRIPIEESSSLLRIAIPLGAVNPATGVETGTIQVRVIRTEGAQSSYSPWRNFFVGQLTGGTFSPGTVAQQAAKAAGMLTVHGMGDTWLIDENVFGQLDFDGVLATAAVEYDGFDVLRWLVERAMNGEVVAIGHTPSGSPINFGFASLPLVDRMIGTMNGALTMELVGLPFPPDPSTFPGFYRAVAHDFEDNAADSIRIVFGAARFSLDLYEEALVADGASVETLDASTLGAIAWFDTFASGFASTILMDSLPAQSGMSQGSFVVVDLSASQGLADIEGVAFNHFAPASIYADSYGLELTYAGWAFAEGLTRKHSLSENLRVGFSSGLVPSMGLPVPEFTIGATVQIGFGDYTVLVTTAPPSPNQTVAVRIVGLDGWITGQDLVTDTNGEALAGPFSSGSSGEFDIVHGLNPEAGGPESQVGTIAKFP